MTRKIKLSLPVRQAGLLAIAALALSIGSCKKDVPENLLPGADDNKVETAVQDHMSTEGSICGALNIMDAAMKARMDAMEPKVQAYIAQYNQHNGSNMRTGDENSVNSLITIPVVFHVIYNLAEQNISDAQLNSQIAALNKDYTATNTDIASVPAGFRTLIGNAQLQFVLAKRDPQGNATNGIIRKSTTVASFSSDGKVCYSSMGGDDAWPAAQYLNIWVCNKSGAPGYSSYPWSGSPATDGVIIAYNYLGTTGTFTNNWSYLLGRTVAHEVGHWFGLVHIWGDVACGDDLVGDTPSQGAANSSCPVFPHMSSCSPNSNGDMFMSYMDNTNDACRLMFSLGQASRMLGYLNTTRASLLTSLGAVAPGGGSTCNIPGGLFSSAVNTASATLNWTSTGASSYNVMYKTSAAPTWNSTSTSATSINISGLIASTSYVFQVQSNCGGSTSAYSSAASFTTLATSCNIPAGLSASSVTTSGALLSWASTGASGYNIMYKPSVGSTWSGATSSTNSLSISGLSASTAYVFQVQSNCGGSTSAYSSTVSFTTLSGACNVPSSLSASSVTSSGAVLNWASTGAGSYNILYKTSAASTWTSASSSTNSLSLSGLAASTSYVFQVQSNCGGSTSGYSSASSFTTSGTVCNVPSGLYATSITSGSISLSWAYTGAISYSIMYKSSVSSIWTTLSSSTNSVSVAGLAASTTYQFQVRSNCASGSSGYSSVVSYTTSARKGNAKIH